MNGRGARVSIDPQLERYAVSWFVSAGALNRARSNSGTARWSLPADPGEATFWAVLRDSRGGASVRSTLARWR